MNTPAYLFLDRCRQNITVNLLEKITDTVRERAHGANKLTNYITDMNPTMTVHPIYYTKVYILDYKRGAFTRLRLMSHSLRVGVGCWSRTPRQERVCQCGDIQVQTEQHVLIDCPLTNRCRARFPILTSDCMNELFNETTYLYELCDFVYALLDIHR